MPLNMNFENDSMVSARYKNINYEDTPKDNFRETLQKQLDHPFYKKADAFRNEIKRETLEKAAKKYNEPFNPNSWSIEQLAKHAMAENYDQTNYIYGMYERLQQQEEAIKTSNLKENEIIRILNGALVLNDPKYKDTYIKYALERLTNMKHVDEK